MGHYLALLVLLVLAWGGTVFGQAVPVSIYPLGGQAGEELSVSIRGNSLVGVSDVWCETDGFEAVVSRVEEIPAEEQERIASELPDAFPRQRLFITLRIDGQVPPGRYPLRFLSPAGISSAVNFHVIDYPAVDEASDGHGPDRPAPILNLPMIVNGRIATPGDVDYYQFKVFHGQKLDFELIACREPVRNAEIRFRPELTLYQKTGSWFDSQRATRIAFNDNAATDVVRDGTKQPIPVSRLVHQFNKAGNYLVSVTSTYGTGGPDFGYQLRVRPSQLPVRDELNSPIVYQEWQNHSIRDSWEEHQFTRPLMDERIQLLRARTTSPLAETLSGLEDRQAAHGDEITIFQENSTPSTGNNLQEQDASDLQTNAEQVSLPALLEGAIQQPGDVDCFRLSVQTGEKIAIEVETPVAAPLRFNPRIEILDAEDQLVISNLHTKEDGAILGLHAKMTTTLEKAGQYFVRIRDIALRHGNADFQYRIWLRPQVPHVGKVVMAIDRVNLQPGKTQLVSLDVELEEGFPGQVLGFVEGLPEGVSVGFPSNDTGSKQPESHAVAYEPVTQKMLIALVADENAPVTESPQLVSIKVRPFDSDVMGSFLEVGEFPLMIVQPIDKLVTQK